MKLPHPEGITWFDKVIHSGAYLWLTVLGGLSLPAPRGRLRALLGMVALGWLIEGLQLMVPGREGSVGDGLANMLGALLGYLLVRWIGTWRPFQMGGGGV